MAPRATSTFLCLDRSPISHHLKVTKPKFDDNFRLTVGCRQLLPAEALLHQGEAEQGQPPVLPAEVPGEEESKGKALHIHL